MTTTFQKRQREMKRQEKQRGKAERRAQKKMAKQTEGENPAAEEAELTVLTAPVGLADFEPQG